MASKTARGDFSQGSIPKTIIKLAFPILMAEIVHIAYNLVDRMYIGHMEGVGTAALTGVGISFPLITLIGAFGNLVSSGGAPLCSMARGEGDNARASRILNTSFTLVILVGAALTLIMYFGADTFLSLMGGDEETLPYALDYFKIYVLGTIPTLISLCMNPFINAQGFARTGMVTVFIGAALNIVLDPVLIYTAGMGIKGAAVATVISQICSAIWVVVFLVGKRPILPVTKLEVARNELGRMLKLGVTGFLFKATNSVTQTVVNITLKTWGGAMSTVYIGSMSIINSVKEVTMCPTSGLVSAAIPVISFNCGAKLYDRVVTAIKTLFFGSLIINLVFWAIMMFTPQVLIGIFSDDMSLVDTAVKCLRVFFLVFPIMSMQITGQNTYVALNYPKYSVFFSMLRKIILIVPLTLLLPPIGLGVMGPFWAEMISQLVSGTACFVTMYFIIWKPMVKGTYVPQQK